MVDTTTGNWSKLLNNQVALVTGAGGSIGRQIAITFAQHGAAVAIADQNKQAAEETAQIINTQVTDRTADAYATQVDVSQEQQVQQWIDSVHQHFPQHRIDILINNAAVFIFGEVDGVSADDWDKILSVNVKGYALCAKHAVRHMKEQRKGSIVHIGSISSVVSQPKFVPYNTTKAAVLQMMRNIAHDGGEYNIRCNAIGPGNIDTPATKKHAQLLGVTYEELVESNMKDHFVKRMGTCADVANAAVFLSSELSKFTTGAMLMIDGGYSTH